MVFFFSKGRRGNFLCRGENKTSNLNPVCIRETPVRGVRSLAPQTKNPRYGPDNSRNAFVLTDHFELRLNNQNVALCKALSKSVYKEIRSNFECAPTARAKFEEKFGRAGFKWKEIYRLSFTVALNTKNARVSEQNVEQILSYKYLSSQSWVETDSIVYVLW